MWFLVFICVSTVGGVPVKPNQQATTHAPAAVHLNDTHHVTTTAPVGIGPLNDTHNMTTAAPVGDLPLNDTHNATTPASVGDLPLNDTHNATSPASAGDMPSNDTHNATHQDPGKAVVKLNPQLINAETLEELQEDMIVQEGDILIPEDRNAVETLWLDAVVPYTISDELIYQTANIHAAFRMISDYTCIRFKPRTYEYNYLKFKNGNGCASFVGCRGGAQPVYYSRSCSVGNLCHEIIHALGLHHEHTRADRDQYISVQWGSIIPARKKNFKVKRGNTLNLPYDVNSIMHYGQYFFSADGGPTVLPRQRGVQMGQRTHLTHLDIQRINRLYHCDERMRWY
ncbi:low choriolytic enzyme-like isoform X1 [Xyrichtys novacula]|uniref:Metalloendopeptidase n=1 Tax=Xyrichtys novacula TaxID=13765 RepID=A0AAV1GZT6_XYRNO|nr:low choriolytic enzyme-like isoform X1 [Xyrichtys novacula]